MPRTQTVLFLPDRVCPFYCRPLTRCLNKREFPVVHNKFGFHLSRRKSTGARLKNPRNARLCASRYFLKTTASTLRS